MLFSKACRLRMAFRAFESHSWIILHVVCISRPGAWLQLKSASALVAHKTRANRHHHIVTVCKITAISRSNTVIIP